MARNLRTLGLALAAVFAMSAVAASGASAAAEFHSSTNPTILTGEQDAAEPVQKFTVGAGATLTCNKLKLEGTAAAATEAEVTLVPHYEECEAHIGTTNIPVTVETNDCAFKFTAVTTGEHGRVHIECAANQKIVVKIGTQCDLEIGEQTPPTGGVHYANLETGGTKAEVTANATVEGITYIRNATELGGCTGIGPTGKYFGKAVIKGYEDNGNTGTSTTPIFHEGSTQIHVWWE